MTTAAATTSASPSASDDSSPMIQDEVGVSESTSSEQPIVAERLQIHADQNNSSSSSSLASSSSSSASPPQKQNESSSSASTEPTAKQTQQSSPDSDSRSPTQPPTEEIKETTPTETTTAKTTASSSGSSSSATTAAPATIATTEATTASTKQQPSPSSKHQQQPQVANASNHNSTEQKRPMNAFLLFCKRQRSLVREKYPNLENRGITKILGDWWSKLDKEQKSKYTDLARQHKEAFMKANPDFKWCKTPNVSNINNNNSSNNITNDCYTSNNLNNHNPHQNKQHQLNLHRQHQQNHNFISATNAELLSLQSAHNHYDVSEQMTNGTNASGRHQLEAPKPPKKRFLERNDPTYTTRNSYNPNQYDINLNGTDIVPYISLDQDTLDRVIDKAFSEDSNSSPSGINTCKCSTRTTTHLTSTTSIGVNPPTLSVSSSSASTTVYPMNVDEPVDFSMNRTIISSRQEVINNIVEKMLSAPNDKTSNFSKSNGSLGK